MVWRTAVRVLVIAVLTPVLATLLFCCVIVGGLISLVHEETR